jgi:hypothetical protein
MAFWVGYGYSFWNYGKGIELEWRLSNAMQFVPALLFLGGVPFIPERYVLCPASYSLNCSHILKVPDGSSRPTKWKPQANL